MKRVHPPIQNQELPTHTPFFNKESDQPFFSTSESFFPKTSIQRKCAECEKEEEQEKEGVTVQKKEDASTDPLPPAATPATNAPAVALFLADDNAVPGPTQMRKSAFLDRLKMEVC